MTENKIIKLLNLAKEFGYDAKRTIGTAPRGVIPLEKPMLTKDLNMKVLGQNYDEGSISIRTIQNELESLIPLALSKQRLNDRDLVNAINNLQGLKNIFKNDEAFLSISGNRPKSTVVDIQTGEKISDEGIKKLLKQQEPEVSPSEQLKNLQERLEKKGEDLKKIIDEKKSQSIVQGAIDDFLKTEKILDDFDRTGYVRATVRQIMREDIQAGKLKLPKEIENEIMQGLGEPIDTWRKVYGEGALEQIDSIADDLSKLRTEEQAAQMARSKFTFEPDVNRPPGSYTPDEPEGKADGGRIGFSSGKSVKKLIEEMNEKLSKKKSFKEESVNPKTGEVRKLKDIITLAEPPKKSIKTAEKKYNQDIIKAADEIFPNYDDPRIAADQILDSYAQMKYGLDDASTLSNEEQMSVYRQAYDYVMDYNRGAIGKTAGKSINISDEATAKAFTDFARENDPEGFKKIQKIVDDINNKNALNEFDVTGREPNAYGGEAGSSMQESIFGYSEMDAEPNFIG